ncbi:SCO6880 family protein [Nocardia carnea]|uniref:SCO6880 family protein n=1 Tax=Nocardia carnea TaxID=37328 RepID=UPI000316969D|nr:SCO6880 family protein [Nocardia carnea]
MGNQLDSNARRTYGAGHEVRRTFAFGLPRKVFYGIFASIVVGVIISMIGMPIIGLGWSLLSVLAALPLSLRLTGKTGYEFFLLEWAWRRQKRSGRNILRAGPLSHAPGGRTRLPGIAAGTEMWWGTDKYGRRFGMIRMHSTSQYTAVLRCSPRGLAGMEQDMINIMVAEWGAFLAKIAEPGDIAATVTVLETIPETGARLHTEMARIQSDTAPANAREWLRQAGAGQAADRTGYQLHARIAITFNAHTEAKRKDPMVMVGELAGRLPELCEQLSRCQVIAEPMSDHEIAATVRRCYDPRRDTEMAVEKLMRYRGAPPPGETVDWTDAGPMIADELDKQTYSHDSAYSRTWVMVDPPRGFFDETVLRSLIAGRADVRRKRVALTHRPLSSADAAESVNADMLSAVGEVTATRGLSTARANLRVAATNQARVEQARGAGVTDYDLVITVSAASVEELHAGGEITDDLATGAHLRIRPAFGQQAAAFQTALGIGVLLPDHATVSRTLQGE